MPDQISVLSIAPVGGGLGGATISSRILHAELNNREDVALLSVDSHRSSGRVAGRLVSALHIAKAVVRKLRTTDVVVLHASVGAVEVLGPLLSALTRIADTPMIIRVFGSSIDLRMARRPRTYRYLLKHHQVLLQTKGLIEHVTRVLPDARVNWFPTHRPILRNVRHLATAAREFVYFGRVNDEKVLRLLGDATGQAKKDWAFDLYGPVDPEAAVRNDLRSRAVIQGPVAHEEVSGIMVRYRALVLPTSYVGEGYPGAIIEAFTCGLPVVASRWRFIPEIVEDGVNGLLFEPDDPVGLAQALDRLATDHELVERLREGARRSAAEFDSERWASRFVDICREAVGLDRQSTSEH